MRRAIPQHQVTSNSVKAADVSGFEDEIFKIFSSRETVRSWTRFLRLTSQFHESVSLVTRASRTDSESLRAVIPNPTRFMRGRIASSCV